MQPRHFEAIIFSAKAAIAIGCACALAVGFLFDKSSDAFNLLRKDGGKKSGTSE